MGHVAQLVERLTCNQEVPGSSPGWSTVALKERMAVEFPHPLTGEATDRTGTGQAIPLRVARQATTRDRLRTGHHAKTSDALPKGRTSGSWSGFEAHGNL